MISIHEAFQAYLDHAKPLAAESVELDQALRRVLAGDQHSSIDLPRFDQSAMDGYALRAADSADSPAELAVTGESAAGHAADAELAPATAWRIFTGAPLPAGADTIIPQERVDREADTLLFNEPYPQGRNIRYRGEEIKTGALLARAGQRLTPGVIASLANAGIAEVPVSRPPRVAILVTGDEVRSAASLKNRPLGEAEIPDSNGRYICSWLKAHGYAADDLHYIADTRQAVSDALAAAAGRADLVITTGGVSVGDKDFIPATAQDCGFEQVFWRVAQKPGKPLFFGRREDALLLGLPGNPGAVLVGMELHARSLLNCLEGQLEPLPAWRCGKLAAGVQADSRRDRLLRMRHQTDREGCNLLQPLELQDSHMLSNLSEAAVLVHVPAQEQDYAASEVLRFIPLTF